MPGPVGSPGKGYVTGPPGGTLTPLFLRGFPTGDWPAPRRPRGPAAERLGITVGTAVRGGKDQIVSLAKKQTNKGASDSGFCLFLQRKSRSQLPVWLSAYVYYSPQGSASPRHNIAGEQPVQPPSVFR